MITHTASSLPPGLLALHGNRTELLADTVLSWLQAHPLDPLEQEVVLVQSNGMAEWFKMRAAEHLGVCTATRVELPARFLWRTYRQVLGRHAVPRYSPLDKTPMTWRLMRLLPTCLDRPEFAPIARFLHPGEPERLLQLAERLSDLFDQYQIYRSDWLDLWAEGQDFLPQWGGQSPQPVPEGQQWQPALWRAVLAELDEDAQGATRPELQQRVLDALHSGQAPAVPVARRVVVFGISHLPLFVLQFLSALSRHSQVLIAVPNPCRFHWADAIDGRELLSMERRRHPLRQGLDLATLPLDAMHAHAHPLLAAWGRQSRDYVRQLDAFDVSESTAPHWQLPRVDVYDEGEATGLPLLAQVQHHIRDMLPLAEHPRALIPASDNSIVFHTTHGIVRELEVLHDQLLHWLAQPATPGHAALQPREVVVMVPAIEEVAPAIRAVFGQYGRHDDRYIPFDIADLTARASSPMVVALEWLLRLPRQRCRLSELCDLLAVPAVAGRFGIGDDELPQLTRWMGGCGIRWGLNGAQRGQLGLDACGEGNSAWFGLRRMLLGYASGSHVLQSESAAAAPAVFGGIEPYDEVGGLTAELAGSFATLLGQLLSWWQDSSRAGTPSDWAVRMHRLLEIFFAPQDESEQAMYDALQTAITRWQEACSQAEFTEEVPLEVAQEAWLQALEEPSLDRRFRAGGVTFCTLMPMRAIPFEVVCLLGMNDGDYPRRGIRNDFDLMQQPGHYRPGDRARRDDDRQLMLEALLAARQRLYVSWTGRHVRDNSELPPSVLVAQLRDYLAQGWQGASPHEQELPGRALLRERTTHHPLQPFSRRYFESNSPVATYAREWRAAHDMTQAAEVPALPPFVPELGVPLTVTRLTAFLRHPAQAFFRHRLNVHFDQESASLDDDEVFRLDGLTAYGLLAGLQQEVAALLDNQATHNVPQLVSSRLESLQRAGRLPLAGLGRKAVEELQQQVVPGLQAWQTLLSQWDMSIERLPIQWMQGDVVLDDWLDGLFLPSDPSMRAVNEFACWRVLDPRDVTLGQGDKVRPRLDRLLPVYVRSLVAAACGMTVQGMVVGKNACLSIAPMEPETARQALTALVDLWREGQDSPLALPFKTALAYVEGADEAALKMYEGDFNAQGESAHICWARCYEDYQSLTADGQFAERASAAYAPLVEWGASCIQVLNWESLEAQEVSA